VFHLFFIITNSIEQSPPWEVSKSLIWSRNSLPFMKPKSSLLCPQEPTTDICHEPDESSPHSPTLFFENHFITYYPFIHIQVFQLIFYLQILGLNICMDFSPYPLYHSSCDHPNNIQWGVQIMKIIIVPLSPASCYFLSLRFKFSPQQPILKHP
jgi:hypothetical protein